MLPDQRPHHLRRLRGVRVLRDHSIISHPPDYKYGKYNQALEYIRAHGHGHAAFLNAAKHWTSACGKYPKQDSDKSTTAR